MTTDTPPIATIRVREMWRNKNLPNKEGRMIKTRVFVGKETVREAFCYTHKKTSSLYVGANEHGWVFGCTHKDKTQNQSADVGLYTQEQKVGHYFIATPPVGRKK